ncbi:MAG: peptidase [Pseudomonadota bacterium]
MSAWHAELARGWLGTPYHHQASVKGVGADCLGLIRGVWREALGDEPERLPAYTPDWGEPGQVEALWGAARRHMVARPAGAALELGDIVLFRMRDGAVAKHLGIVGRGAPGFSVIHAYQRHGVVETPLSEAWQRRIVAVFQFPEGVE